MNGGVDQRLVVPDVTMVVTSCRYIDLLERTLRSFVEKNDYPVKKIIVIEDSDCMDVYRVSAILKDYDHEIILNGENIGQLASIDKAYRLVETDYIFHVEDDWEFCRSGFIGGAIRLLSDDPSLGIVLVRAEEDMPYYVRSLKTRKAGSFEYKRLFPQLHYKWGSFTFNPSIIRVSDYLRVGPYKRFDSEEQISIYFKSLGLCMGWLIGGGARHIGDGKKGSGPGYVKSTAVGRGMAYVCRKWKESLKRKFWHMLRVVGFDTEDIQKRF